MNNNVKKEPSLTITTSNDIAQTKNEQTKKLISSSFKVGVVWSILGNAIFTASQWAILITLTKTTTPVEVGEFSFALALVAPLYMMLNLQLRTVQVTDTLNKYSFNDYLFLRVALTTVAVILISLSATILEISFATLLLVTIQKAIESIGDIFQGYIHKRQQMKKLSQSLIGIGVLSVLCLIPSILFNSTLTSILLLVTCGRVISLFLFEIKPCRDLMQAFKEDAISLKNISGLSIIKQLAVLSLPLGLVMMLNSLSINVPRYALETFLGKKELGIFAALAYVTIAFTTFYQAILQVASPKFAEFISQKKLSNVESLILKLNLITVVAGTVGLLFTYFYGNLVLSFLYAPEYAKRIDCFSILIFSTLVGATASMYGCVVTAAQVFKEQTKASIIVVITTLVAAYLLVPFFGINGAAFAVLIGTVVKLYIFACLWKKIRLQLI
jgi:O-antigen/teichoic acid export membrane protein